MKYYNIAAHTIALSDEFLDLTAATLGKSLQPFECDASTDSVLQVELADFDISEYPHKILDTFNFAEADAQCTFARYENCGGGFLFAMTCSESTSAVIFLKPNNSTTALCNITLHNRLTPSLLRFGLWMMYGIAVNPYHTVAIHSSVICNSDAAVMFLGESGTGKSTHTRLWRENIDNVELLNDDSPIVRIIDGKAIVFGSPWSGKTPCYKQSNRPIAAVVRLSQAPHNKISSLSTIAALGALLPSCPPAFAYDKALQSNILDTLSQLLAAVPVYHLECLPNADAAHLSFDTTLAHR